MIRLAKLDSSLGWKVWLSIALFQAVFGYYYVWSEHKKGDFFDPGISSQVYLEKELRGAWLAPIAGGDNQAYNRAAYSLLETGSYLQANGSPSAWAPPGYPLFLAVIYSIFGYNYLPVLLIQALLLSGAQVLLSRTCGVIWGHRAAWVTLALLVCNLRTSMFVGYIYTECLFLFLISAALAIVFRNKKTHEHSSFGAQPALALGLILGYSLIVRPVALPAAIVLLGYLLYINRTSWRWVVVTGVLCGLPAFTWLVRNQIHFGEWILTTSSPITYAEGNNDFYFDKSFWRSFQNAKTNAPYPPLDASLVQKISDTHAPDTERTVSKIRIEQIRIWSDQTPRSKKLWLIAYRTKAMFSPETFDMSPRQRLICAFYWLLLFPAAAWGYLSNPNLSIRRTWLAFGLSLILLPTLVVIGPSLRYQIPMQYVLTVFSALGWIAWTNRLQNRWNSLKP
jgi:4-amino-4-deoxy-L-arabinose transferase-like glycosyltransferase